MELREAIEAALMGDPEERARRKRLLTDMLAAFAAGEAELEEKLKRRAKALEIELDAALAAVDALL
jgi:hypothetical protein